MQMGPVAARNIAGLVAPQGTLLVLATTREEDSEVTGPQNLDSQIVIVAQNIRRLSDNELEDPGNF